MQKFDFDHMKDGDRIISQGKTIEWEKCKKEYGCAECAQYEVYRHCLPCKGGIWKEVTKCTR